jgi:hypothetical protein
VAISDQGNIAVGAENASASYTGDHQGVIYLFQQPTGGWQSGGPQPQAQRLAASDGRQGDQLGASLTFGSAGEVIAGAPAAGSGGSYQGAGYVFFVNPTVMGMTAESVKRYRRSIGSNIPLKPRTNSLPTRIRRTDRHRRVSGRAVLRRLGSSHTRRPFKVKVTGRQIRAITFTVGKRRIKRILVRPSRAGQRLVITVDPTRLKLPRGWHRVTARVQFSSDSGTRPVVLGVRFRRA